jgi:hypothetical protein
LLTAGTDAVDNDAGGDMMGFGREPAGAGADRTEARKAWWPERARGDCTPADGPDCGDDSEDEGNEPDEGGDGRPAVGDVLVCDGGGDGPAPKLNYWIN